MHKFTKATLLLTIAALSIGTSSTPTPAQSIRLGVATQSTLTANEVAQWVDRLPKRQTVNATTFNFKGQCKKRSDCGSGTWSCCNTSCEPVATCK